jgi:hypothetical protein
MKALMEQFDVDVDNSVCECYCIKTNFNSKDCAQHRCLPVVSGKSIRAEELHEKATKVCLSACRLISLSSRRMPFARKTLLPNVLRS